MKQRKKQKHAAVWAALQALEVFETWFFTFDQLNGAPPNYFSHFAGWVGIKLRFHTINTATHKGVLYVRIA